MENEMINFIKVWSLAIVSACYAFSLSRIFHIPKGIPRLLFILPLIYLFIVIPSYITFIHLAVPTILYLVWLGNFKLVLYAFDLGPLSTNPNMSLLHFVATCILPIKFKYDPSSNKTYPDGANNQNNIYYCRCALFFVKLLALTLVVKIYDYQENLPSCVISVIYYCHTYLWIEITLVTTAALARMILGCDLYQVFNDPYLSTSLQDFWGRRWNLMVSDILRVSIYSPIRHVIFPLFGKKWAQVVGIMAAFVVSGFMHEVIFYYFTREWPTWEVTYFFVLHGVCIVMEVVVKEVVAGRFQLHRVVSGLLTTGFVGATGVWLFLPQLSRNGVTVKIINECNLMIDFVKLNILHLSWH